MGYRAIESYGLIGDLHTAALVGIDGAMIGSACPTSTPPASSPRSSTTSAAADSASVLRRST